MNSGIHQIELVTLHNIINDLSSFLYIFIHRSYYNINPCASASIDFDDSLILASRVL